MASSVELEPAPAITGTRLFATSTHSSTTPLVLVMTERGARAGGTYGHEPVRALRDLPFDQAPKRLLVDTSATKRRDQCRKRTPEHGLLPILGLFLTSGGLTSTSIRPRN